MALHPAVARTVPFRRRSASLGHPSPESRGPRHRLEPAGRPSGRTSGRRLVAVVTLTALALTGVGVGAAAAAAPKHLGLSAPKHLSLLLSAPKHLAKAPKHLGRAPKHLSRAPKHLATAPKHLSAQTVGTATVAFTTSAKHGGKAAGKAAGKVKGTGKGAGTVMGDRAGDRHGPRARGDGAGGTVAAFWPWRGVLHGRFTVMSKERSAPAAPQLVTVQRGEVTAVDGAKVTVRSEDGFEAVWTVDPAALIAFPHGRVGTLADVTTGLVVGMLGSGDEAAPTARIVWLPRTVPAPPDPGSGSGDAGPGGGGATTV